MTDPRRNDCPSDDATEQGQRVVIGPVPKEEEERPEAVREGLPSQEPARPRSPFSVVRTVSNDHQPRPIVFWATRNLS